MIKLNQALLITSLLMGIASCASDSNSGGNNVTLAKMNWASADLMANVDKIILEEGYGFKVTIVDGDTIPTFNSMNKSASPDVAGELWISAIKTSLNTAVTENRLLVANAAPMSGAGEGWFVPSYVLANNPSLKTVLDVIERPDLFPHPDDASKGAFYSCPQGWGCALANANLYRAFNMEAKGWLLVDPGSDAGLTNSIATAVGNNANWFGYHWSPTANIARYKLTMLDFGVSYAGDDNWKSCIVKPVANCSSPKQTSWIPLDINIVVTKNFSKNTELMTYFSKRTVPVSALNTTLAYMADANVSGLVSAKRFLADYESIWSRWVDADVAAKVKSSL